MEIIVNNYNVLIEENPTNIYGLSFEPKMVEYNNDSDGAPFHKSCPIEVSLQNYNLTSDIIKNYLTHGIMEIGVSRNGDGSFTNAILNQKPNNIPYIGVDIEDKSFLNSVDKKIFTIQEDSFNQEKVREFLKKIGIDRISVLFIDGHHSVNACINDWKYADLLSEKSIVIFHDTNYHPGPRVIIEAIDKNLFKVERFFINENDYGMAVATKI